MNFLVVGAGVSGTTIVYEYPEEYRQGENEPYYHVRNDETDELFDRYMDMVKNVEGLYVTGRLGNYRYYDMAPAVLVALRLGEKIVSEVQDND